jgi:PPP family 3-phenylpropionic acid transporter
MSEENGRAFQRSDFSGISLRGSLPAFIALYAAIYAAFGIASPYWPRFFEASGLEPEQIGLLLALGLLIKLVAGPLAGRVADRTGALRTVLAICVMLSAGAALGLTAASWFWLLVVVHLCQQAALAPTTTLTDALALYAAKPGASQQGFEYGWVRGSASAAFVLGTLAAGQILGRGELSAIVWLHAALLAGAALAVAFVPALERVRAADEPQHFHSMRELLENPLFRRICLIAALVFGSHAMHDTFAVIRWNAAGIGPGTISMLWSLSVTAEVVVFFLLGPPLVNRLGAAGAAALAALAGIIRWVTMSQTAALVPLTLVQPLHGFTFALLHLACMRLLGDIAPARLAATAQALYALCAGLASALLVLLSGALYGRFGALGFVLMALLCALALPLTYGLRARVRSRVRA